jgi:ribosomal protein S18 acetylase RimI-like enzyme
MAEKDIKFIIEDINQLSKVDTSMVRWLIVPDDFNLFRSLWNKYGPNFTLDEWKSLYADGFSYCSIIINGEIIANAAVWKYSDTAWEVAAVSVLPEYRQKGYGKAIVAFVAEYILKSGRIATCTTDEDNIAMRETALSVGFCIVNT